jgi:steroid delta-isomerase-like uncharacterized protein
MGGSSAEQLIDRLARAWASHDRAGVVALFTDDCLYEDVALGKSWHGHEELAQFVEEMFETVPDFGYEVTSRFATPDHAAIEYVLSGTPRRDPQGNPISCGRFQVRGSSILDLREGRIRRNTDYVDMATIMRQMGVGGG